MNATTVELAPVSAKPAAGLSFGRVLLSEWLKFTTLRSTAWTLAMTLVVMVGLSVLVAFLWSAPDAGDEAWTPAMGMHLLTQSHTFAQLIAAVVGVLVVGGEYSTGMIRSTLTTVPTRTPVLAAKAVVAGGSVFAIGVTAMLLSYAATLPILRPLGGAADLSDLDTWRRFLGMGLFLAAIALLSLGITTLVRNTAAGLATSLGVILLLPLVAPLLGGLVSSTSQLGTFLPTTAGSRIMGPVMDATEIPAGMIVLGPWEGYGILLLYVGATLAAATVVLRRRDA